MDQPANNIGTLENPLVIDEFDVDLAKLETICSLIDKKYHKRVKSLTSHEVKELEAVAETLSLDTERYKFLERTYLNN